MKKVTMYIGAIILLAASVYFVYIFFIGNNKEIKLFSNDETKVVIEADLINDKSNSIVENNQILFTVDFVKKYLDPNILWDSTEKKVTVTTKDKVIRMKTQDMQALVNNKPVKLSVPVKEEKNGVYVSLDFLKDFYNIKYQYIKSNNVIVIDYVGKDEQYTKVNGEKAVIRKGMSRSEPIVKVLKNSIIDEKIKIFKEYSDWYKVRASDGSVGFIEKKQVDKKEKIVNENTKKNKDENINKNRSKISLAWHAIYSNTNVLPVNTKIDGLDVIAPTWFDIGNEKGNLSVRANKEYVDLAHSKGYKIWALLANDFNNKDRTHNFLKSTTARETMINELIVNASMYSLDGINIDFENILPEDRANLIQLLREMTPMLREQGIIVSVDINTSGNYDRKLLSNVVDYLVLMAYDQHWKNGGKAGSVADYNWVENLVKVLVNDDKIPSNKVILGMPFYTRNWGVTSSDGVEKVVSSEAVSMEKSMRIIEDNKATVKWDKNSEQFYAEYIKDNITNKIWMEEQNSINWKSSLVHKYNLAGTAAWKINFEVSPVWDILYKNLKIIKNYNEWTEKNSDNSYELIISKKYPN